MEHSHTITIPRYLKIAVDIAARIASGEIREGEKLKGRSILSTEYNVSPETIRRSMSILSDKDVVRVAAGSGIFVTSKEQAIRFLKSFRNDESVAEMNRSLANLLQQREKLDEEISEKIKQIIDMYRYMHTELITPMRIAVPPNSHFIGKSIAKLQVWHHTGATIIGILQNEQITISPGPYYEFEPDDQILIVGDEQVAKRFMEFVEKTDNEIELS